MSNSVTRRIYIGEVKLSNNDTVIMKNLPYNIATAILESEEVIYIPKLTPETIQTLNKTITEGCLIIVSELNDNCFAILNFINELSGYKNLSYTVQIE